jgi:hypothetical protein
MPDRLRDAQVLHLRIIEHLVDRIDRPSRHGMRFSQASSQ